MASCCTKGEISVKTVIVNGKVHNVSGSILVYVNRLERGLSRHAVIKWIDNDNCVITDNGVQIDRPMTSLSSGHKTTIKEG